MEYKINNKTGRVVSSRQVLTEGKQVAKMNLKFN